MSEAENPRAYDKTGREIMVGDVVKIFHYIGARRKHHYMYKHVTGVREWPSGFRALFFDHLTMQKDDGFYVALDDRHYSDYEIVQSIDAAFEDRPRRHPTQEQG